MRSATRIAVLLVAALCLGAGAVEGWRGLAVSHAQKLRNWEAWTAMDASEQDSWRAQLDTFMARPADERSQLYRRHAALNRMRQDQLRVLGRPPTRAEVERQLQLLPQRIATFLQLPVTGFAALQAALAARISEHLSAFLDNLVRAEVLAPHERQELAALDFEERVDASLVLQKHQEIYLFVERNAPDEQHELDQQRGQELFELQDLAPLEVSQRLRELRQRQGLLGRAGRTLGLSEAEQQELSEAPMEEVMRVLARLYRPRIRQLLVERGKDAERIDQLLRLPPRQLERVLNRLLLEQP